MRVTPFLSGGRAAVYQACCAATALRNWSIMPGLMSERRTTLSLPSHGIGAAAGACCATAGVGQSAGLRGALKTVRARNRRERRMAMSPMRRQYHGRVVADHLRPANRATLFAPRAIFAEEKARRSGTGALHDEGEFFQLFAHGGERAEIGRASCR